jgi:hypothetical protein
LTTTTEAAMTTIQAPPERTPRVLLAGVLGALATTAVTVVLAVGTADGPAVRAALVGGGLVLIFFAFGAIVVGVAARVAPMTAVLVALVTYTFQVVLVALVFAALTKADAFDEDLSAGWLAAGLIAGTFAWMADQPEPPVPGGEVGAA